MADTSTDSHDITADLIEQTPIEKCSLNPRRGRNSRRLLTGFIIYASEVRKEVVEKYPDQNFGFISKLVGDKWRELSTDLRFKYHQRALIHNKRIKELAAREGVSLGDIDLANGSVIKAPKPTKTKKVKPGKEGKHRFIEASSQNLDKSSPETPSKKKLSTANGNNNYANDSSMNGQIEHQGSNLAAASKNHLPHRVLKGSETPYSQQAPVQNHTRPKKVNTVDSATQTPQIRYIEPPPKKALKFSDAFLKRIQELTQKQQEFMLVQGNKQIGHIATL